MQLQIQIVQTDQTDKKTSTGGYKQLEIAYKNLSNQNKMESKKIMSFAQPMAFASLAGSKQGDVFTIKSEKNEKTGYWDWLEAVQSAPGAPTSPVAEAKTSAGATHYKSIYETPAERAKKQVYIVKQSSLSAALKFMEVSEAKEFTHQDVIDLAQRYTDWVLSSQAPESVKLSDMDDDIPY